ncbi:MAG: outer membrane beta-barrel protein [Paludibacteraceae bacterium]|nr:outer membrane beta-barrel protein [Paludibacteraceae bacterium]
MKQYTFLSPKSLSPLFFFLFFTLLIASSFAQSITGTIIDKKTKETLPGAYITVVGLNQGTVTDMDGYYNLPIKTGKYSLLISYVSYESKTIKEVQVESSKNTVLNVELEEAGVSLQTIEVVVRQRTDTDLALNRNIKSSLQVVSGVSSQQISKTVDKDASEVIKRVPGVTIIGSRFVVIRGLNQRYNNVWLNNAATPSSEADNRAFSFDIIPSSLIDNMMVFKSPAPELPADFSGGFIKILTKIAPENNRLTLNYTTSYQQNTTFKNFLINSRTANDYIGLGANSRNLPTNFPSFLEAVSKNEKVNSTKAINEGWNYKNTIALPDQSISAVYNTSFYIGNAKINNVSSANYSNSYQTHETTNKLFGIYQIDIDKPSLSKDFTENHYTNNSKFGLLSNFSITPNGANRYEFRNFYNQIGSQRVVSRQGEDYSNDYSIQETEMFYMSRSIYSGQLSGAHSLNADNKKLDWTLGYSYANRYEPDRKIITARLNNNPTSQYYQQYRIENNDIIRNFQELKENLLSGGTNYEYLASLYSWNPTIKTGLYAEYKNRNFAARNFIYDFNMSSGTLPNNYKYLPIDEMFADEYIQTDGVLLKENTNKSDSYTAANFLTAAYAGANLPFGNLNIYLGVRAENNWIRLNGYESDGVKPVEINEAKLDIFPSINIGYTINEKNMLRLAYGNSINRPEFREIAPYVYYDFEAFAFFEGNSKLKNSYIQNVDFRYELYPSPNETISLSIFYKSFKNPIELSYFEVGGQYQYTYTNALSAQSIGTEIDIKKNLDFIKLPNFSLLFNSSLIQSNVFFAEGSINRNRPMEGQSPYLVNAGLFYENEEMGINASILYNVIGKRISAIGVTAQNSDEDIPDVYEMSRNIIDLSINKIIGESCTIKLGIKDLLNSAIEYKQFPSFKKNSIPETREQTTRTYTPGINIQIGVSYKL